MEDLGDLIDEGLEVTKVAFSEEDMQVAPELVNTARDINTDLNRGEIEDAYDKLQWYFTDGPLAHLQLKSEVSDFLESGMPGAYKVGKNIAKTHENLLILYKKFQKAPELNDNNNMMYR